MDIIYKYLSESSAITNEEVLTLVELVEEEQYDTESVFDDVGEDGKEKSNILNGLQSEITITALHQYIKHKIGINIYIYY